MCQIVDQRYHCLSNSYLIQKLCLKDFRLNENKCWYFFRPKSQDITSIKAIVKRRIIYNRLPYLNQIISVNWIQCSLLLPYNSIAFMLDEQLINHPDLSTVKHQLLINKDKLVLIGYSTQSLKRNQYLYETFVRRGLPSQADQQHLKTHSKYERAGTGRISIFGVTMHTPYIPYLNGTFINLVTVGGKKLIELNDFDKHSKTQLVKIDYEQYQLKHTTENYAMSTTADSIILVQSTSYPPVSNIVVHKFAIENPKQQHVVFRVIEFDFDPPSFIGFFGGMITIINQEEIKYIGSQNLEPQYHELNNWENIKVVGVHHNIIISFKTDSSDLYELSLSGRVSDLACNVRFFCIRGQSIFVVREDPSSKVKYLLQYRYDETKQRCLKHKEQEVAYETKAISTNGDLLKLDLETTTGHYKRFIMLDIPED